MNFLPPDSNRPESDYSGSDQPRPIPPAPESHGEGADGEDFGIEPDAKKPHETPIGSDRSIGADRPIDLDQPIEAEEVIWAELVPPEEVGPPRPPSRFPGEPAWGPHGEPVYPYYQVLQGTQPPRPVPVREPFSKPRRLLPAILFGCTCLTTLWAGVEMSPFGGTSVLIPSLYQLLTTGALPEGITGGTISGIFVHGLWYAVPLMTILTFHEMGHFIQARRYKVPASWPFFIPMPFGLIGTMGAVIGMASHKGDRKALFDIGITGPLAGLIPTIICCLIGLYYSEVKPIPPNSFQFGDPLLLKFLTWWKFGPIPAGHDVVLHPIGFAGWVGLLITSLNLIPIGQLDGGHVLYALLLKWSHVIARLLLFGAFFAVAFYYPAWIIMVLLLFMMGAEHPPTADDTVPLGRFRVVLGWLTLAFIFVGFTPMPFKF